MILNNAHAARVQMAFRRSKYLESMYDMYNAKYWRGKLPKIRVGYDRRAFEKRRCAAAVIYLYNDNRFCAIIFNPAHLMPFKYDSHLDVTMLHEMCHVKLSEYQCKSRADLHGRRFKAERQRLIDAGAFTELL